MNSDKEKSPVLLVEDNRGLAERYRRLLLASDFDCRVAESLPAALQQLETERFELVLSDCYLPELSGPAVVEASKKIDPDLPVACLTVSPTDALRHLCLRAGAELLIAKPSKPTLLAKLTLALDRSTPVAADSFSAQAFVRMSRLVEQFRENPCLETVQAIEKASSINRFSRLEAAASTLSFLLEERDKSQFVLWLERELQRLCDLVPCQSGGGK